MTKTTYSERAIVSLLEFQAQAADLLSEVNATGASRQLPARRLSRLAHLAEEASQAALPLLDSLRLIELTGLDVVDMETRMKGESRRLGEVLEGLGEVVRDQHFIRVRFGERLVGLEEISHELAGTLFPSAVQGLNRVNSKLWEFSRLALSRYRRILNREVEEESLTESQQGRVESAFFELEAPFENANQLLNQLAIRELGRRRVIARLGFVRKALGGVGSLTGRLKRRDYFKPFKRVLKDSAKVAREVDKRLGTLRIPLFPQYDDLEELRDLISPELYRSLGGLQSFALLNIASRMRSIGIDGGHLLSSSHGIQVWKVYSDRIYLDAEETFLDAVRETTEFVSADPALHRFRAGSLKQVTFPQGNLQLSYSRARSGRVSVDADLDLYRDPVLHFFGEVLINHMSGGKTDGFRIREVLDRQGVLPLGGFEVYSPP